MQADFLSSCLLSYPKEYIYFGIMLMSVLRFRTISIPRRYTSSLIPALQFGMTLTTLSIVIPTTMMSSLTYLQSTASVLGVY
ncbi:hypothetical protein V1524DRAFT_439794, partial [Lipomyces starkeyi]